MAEPLDVVVLEIPARIADLAFRISIPRDWNPVDLPGEEVDFGAPDAFFPLLLAVAPWAAVVLSVAARPGFEDGTLQDWCLFLLSSQGIRPTAFRPASIGAFRGLVGIGSQQQDDTALEMRFAFFEDGGRLVYLGLMAPEAISAPLEPIWKTALDSFVLERPQGQNAPVGPGMGIVEERAAEATAPEAQEPEPAVSPAVSEASKDAEETPKDAEEGPPAFTESDFGHYAKADDTSTLDTENPINARLLNQGVGFVPNILETDQENKTVKLGAGALQALIRVAFGWHVIDDGRRTMVLDPGGKIQINLSVIRKDGRTIDQLRDDIQAEAEQSYPNPEFLRLEDDGIWGLAIRNIAVEGEPVEQLHMLTAWASDSAMLRARVTSDPESMRFAANYADLILKSAEYGAREDAGDTASKLSQEDEEESFSNEPEWMRQARRLERADCLEDAEQLIRDSVPNLHFAITIADLYRGRWIRLAKRDPEKAKEARQQAADWAYNYASYATSGGEGAALSLARDQFLKTLGPGPLE